jgi:phage portal protein BeeE
VRSIFWRRWIQQAIYWGKGYLLFQVDADGAPIAGTLHVLATNQVRIGERTGVYEVGDPNDPTRFDDDGYLRMGGRAYRVARLDNPHHENGVFAAHPDLFRLAAKLGRYTEGTFNSGIPAGYLKSTVPGMTQAQADELSASWMAKHGGDRRSIAVLNATLEFHPISINPVDSNLIEVARAGIADIAFAFGMAPEVLGVTLGATGTYSNIRDWWRQHRDFSLSPWVDTVGGTLTALTPAGVTVAVDLDGHSRPDEMERQAIYTAGIANGTYTVEEARTLEGRVTTGE